MSSEALSPRPRLLRWLFLTAGMLSVTLGFVGIFVPILPTTPFLLLAAACFLRSSDRLYHWLMFHRVFGPYLRNYRKHRALSLRVKVITTIGIWASIGYAVLFAVESIALRIALLLVACAVNAHVLRLKPF
ncbi:MAG: Inner membrane protein YbaN [Candidatus Latescibacteria bacterium ADurb.Bin168]|nr:MAG: Inner membrane protein YbaN [Candidatus Latescibacteria bacterium ADurb.Bin168]